MNNYLSAYLDLITTEATIKTHHRSQIVLACVDVLTESRNIVHVVEFEIYQDDPETLQKIVSK